MKQIEKQDEPEVSGGYYPNPDGGCTDPFGPFGPAGRPGVDYPQFPAGEVPGVTDPPVV